MRLSPFTLSTLTPEVILPEMLLFDEACSSSSVADRASASVLPPDVTVVVLLLLPRSATKSTSLTSLDSTTSTSSLANVNVPTLGCMRESTLEGLVTTTSSSSVDVVVASSSSTTVTTSSVFMAKILL